MAAKIVLAYVFRVLAASVMIFMSVPKIVNPAWLKLMGVPWLPSDAALLVGVFLPWAELSLGVLLLLPCLWRPAARTTSVLLGLFIVVLAVFWAEGRADCGCAGGFFPKWASAPPFGIARNLFLMCGLWLASSLPPVRLVWRRAQTRPRHPLPPSQSFDKGQK